MKSATITEYCTNRANYPIAELKQHQGKWVAFSADGLRIVACGVSLAEGYDAVQAAKEDPERVVWEHIDPDENEIELGAAELY